MRKFILPLLITIFCGLLIQSCGSGESKPAEEMTVDSSGVSPEEEPAAVDSAAPMADTGYSISPTNRVEDQDQKKGKEQTKQGEKSRKTQAIQQ